MVNQKHGNNNYFKSLNIGNLLNILNINEIK